MILFLIITFLLSSSYVKPQSSSFTSTTSSSTLTTSSSTSTTTQAALVCSNSYGSGTKLEGFCTQINDCKGAAFIGNCTSSQICCIRDSNSSTSNSTIITKYIFLKIAGNTARNDWLYNYFSESMVNAQINTKNRAAAYLSQLIGETDYFKSIESIKPEKDYDLGIGNNEAGAGSLYRGRGGILLRGKSNYQLARDNITGLANNLVLRPEYAAFPSYAFKIAAWFWTSNAYVVQSTSLSRKESLNILADGTFFNYTMLTNSLTNNLQSLKQRADINDLILKELSYNTLKRGQGIICSAGENQNETGFAIPICLSEPYCGCEGRYEMTSCPYGRTSDNKCRNSAIVKCCIEKCKAALDLVILSDSSGSIGADNFQIIRNFLTDLVKSLPIGYNETRVSIINFSNRADLLIDLSKGITYEILLQTIKDMPFLGSTTYTNLALKMANEKVLIESAGMRPEGDGVPKIVMVITDGESTNSLQTLNEAQNIKGRKFNIISVGIVGANILELNAIATSANDVYFVNNFNQVLEIITSLSRTTCLQSAEIPSKTEIVSRVEKDTYKYFRLSLVNPNETLDEFTFELQTLKGLTDLFYSFENENPKSESDYLMDEDSGQNDENFIDSLAKFSKNFNIEKFTRIKIKKEAPAVNETKLYPVRRPQTGQNDYVYFSVKGLDDENDFRLFVYDFEITSTTSTTTSTTSFDTGLSNLTVQIENISQQQIQIQQQIQGMQLFLQQILSELQKTTTTAITSTSSTSTTVAIDTGMSNLTLQIDTILQQMQSFQQQIQELQNEMQQIISQLQTSPSNQATLISTNMFLTDLTYNSANIASISVSNFIYSVCLGSLVILGMK